VLIFGGYMIAQGVVLMLYPTVLLNVFGLEARDVWVRVTGWALVALGFYYAQNARANFTPFFWWTVPVRLAQFAAFTGFVGAGLVGATALVPSALELASGAWTWWALRADARSVK
jgi:hypothetical protein